MRGAVLDLLGMYQYDNTVLDLMQIPEALNRPTFIDNLLMESAEMEILYSNIGFLKQAIGSWSAKNLHVWEELYATTQYEYNPIWNKDGTILETVTRNLAYSDDHTRTDNLKSEDDYTRTDNLKAEEDYTRTDNLKTEEDHTRTDDLKNTTDSTTTRNVFGYNSSTEAPSDKEILDLDGSNTGTQRNAGSTSNTGTQRNAGSTSNTGTQRNAGSTSNTGTQRNAGSNTEYGTIATARTEQGNIGLTSTQQLIEEQRKVVELNLMDVIIKDFIQRFCIGVY